MQRLRSLQIQLFTLLLRILFLSVRTKDTSEHCIIRKREGSEARHCLKSYEQRIRMVLNSLVHIKFKRPKTFKRRKSNRKSKTRQIN